MHEQKRNKRWENMQGPRKDPTQNFLAVRQQYYPLDHPLSVPNCVFPSCILQQATLGCVCA